MIISFVGRYRFLSNFYQHPLLYNYDFYPTAEHAYQASKTLYEKDKQEIRNAPTPGKAKRLGRKVILRLNWEEVKVSIMRDILQKKFVKIIMDFLMHDLLIATGTEELVEGNNWHDNYWGNCYCNNCIHIEGQNMLGKLLQEIRSTLSGK